MTYRCGRQITVSNDGHQNAAAIMADYINTCLASQVQKKAFTFWLNCGPVLLLLQHQFARLRLRTTQSACREFPLQEETAEKMVVRLRLFVFNESAIFWFSLTRTVVYMTGTLPACTIEKHAHYAVEEHNVCRDTNKQGKVPCLTYNLHFVGSLMHITPGTSLTLAPLVVATKTNR